MSKEADSDARGDVEDADLDAIEEIVRLAELGVDVDESMKRLPESLRRRALRLVEGVVALHHAGAHEPPRNQPPERLGRYAVVRCVGAGGQGSVFLARDAELGRFVALKILRNAGEDGETTARRLRREAQILAMAAHRGICGLLDYGVENGTAYLVMEYLDRGDLETRLGNGPLPWREAVALVADAADALHFAHEKGLIHRDVKPSNILLDAAGRAVVSDFGLARDVESTLTRSEAGVGTPSYISPEQIGMSPAELDRRTDVFSLGAVLYRCVTGKLPFAAAERHGVLHAVMHREPIEVRSTVRGLPRELSVVVKTALAKNRDDRYPTAERFATDLRALLDGRPVSASLPGWSRRIAAWARRNPLPATALAVAAVSLVMAAWALRGLRTALANSDARRAISEALLTGGKDPAPALARVVQGVDATPDPDPELTASARSACAELLTVCREVGRTTTDSAHAVGGAISSDATEALVVDSRGTLRFVRCGGSVPNPAAVRHPDQDLVDAAYLLGKRMVVAVGKNGGLSTFDVERRRWTPVGFESSAKTVVSACDSRAAVGDGRGVAHFLSCDEYGVLRSDGALQFADSSPVRVAFAESASVFAAASSADAVVVVGTYEPGTTPRQVATLHVTSPSSTVALDVSNDGTRVWAVTADGKLRRWGADGRNAEPPVDLRVAAGADASSAFRRAAVDADTGRIALWSGSDLVVLAVEGDRAAVADRLAGPLVRPETLCFDARGGRLLAGGASGDPVTRVFDLDSGVRRVPSSPVSSVPVDWPSAAFEFAGGELLVAGVHREQALVMRPERPARPPTVAAVGSPANFAVLSREGRRLAVGDRAGRLWVFRTHDLAHADWSAVAHGGAFSSIAFADEDHLTTASFDGTAAVWDARTGSALLKTEACDRPARAAAFDPRSGTLYVGGEDTARSLVAYETRRPAPPRTLLPTRGAADFAVHGLEFDAVSGSLLALTSDRPRLFAAGGTERVPVDIGGGNPQRALFARHRDASYLVAVSGRETGYWRTYRPQGTPTSSERFEPITSVCATPVGLIVAGRPTGEIAVWRPPDGDGGTPLRLWFRARCFEKEPVRLTVAGHDGRRIAAIAPSGAVALLNADPLDAARTLIGGAFRSGDPSSVRAP